MNRVGYSSSATKEVADLFSQHLKMMFVTSLWLKFMTPKLRDLSCLKDSPVARQNMDDFVSLMNGLLNRECAQEMGKQASRSLFSLTTDPNPSEVGLLLLDAETPGFKGFLGSIRTKMADVSSV